MYRTHVTFSWFEGHYIRGCSALRTVHSGAAKRAPSRGTWRHVSMRLADLASPPQDLALDYVQVAAGSPFLDRSNSDGFERFWKFETDTIPGDALHSDRTTAECFSYGGMLLIMSSLLLVEVLINCMSYLPSTAQA